MIPYVRMSFKKHFKDGMKYLCDIELDEIPDDTPIDNEMYLASPKAYKYAMNMTEKELMQAVQGMYHNLEIWA